MHMPFHQVMAINASYYEMTLQLQRDYNEQVSSLLAYYEKKFSFL